MLGDKPEVWRNETDVGKWLRVKLKGQSIGAKVRVGSQWREQSSATGYASSNLDALHFGLGEDAVVPSRDHLAEWQRQVIRNAKAEQTLVVREYPALNG